MQIAGTGLKVVVFQTEKMKVHFQNYQIGYAKSASALTCCVQHDVRDISPWGNMLPLPSIGQASAGLSQARRGQARLDSSRFGSSSTQPASAWLHSARLGLTGLNSLRLGWACLCLPCFSVPGWSAVRNCVLSMDVDWQSWNRHRKMRINFQALRLGRCQRHRQMYTIGCDF